LIAERGVSFEMVATQIADGKIIDIYCHSNSEKYPNQFIYIVELKNYFYHVPFIWQGENILLITVFPSRKAAKTYQSKSS